VKKTRQNKRLELGSDSIRTEKALVDLGSGLWDAHPAGKRARPRRVKGYSLGSKIKKYRECFFLRALREQLLATPQRFSDGVAANSLENF
jgi:hypothetical protein